MLIEQPDIHGQRSVCGSDAKTASKVRLNPIPESTGNILAARSNSAYVASWLRPHSDYVAAKSGDAIAALRLVCDLVPKAMLRQARSRWPGAVFLFGSSYEQTGLNMIPAALAWQLSQAAGGDVAFLTQMNRVFHTGSSAAARLAFPALFGGKIERNHTYVLVDDVAVLGGTIAQMTNVVLAQGGKVAGIAVVINATRTEHLWPTNQTIDLLHAKFGNDLETILSIKTEAFTRPESEYLAGFRNSESVRDRLTRARDEGGARFDARGVSKESSPAIGLRSGVIETLIDAADVLDGDPDFEECPKEPDVDAEPDGVEFYLS